MTDESQATDLMLSHFKAAWEAQTPPVPPAIYENTNANPPKDGSAFVKAFVRHASRPQVTVGVNGGTRRFRARGLLMFEVHSALGVGVTQGTEYAKIIRAAFEGAGPGGIRFTNARVAEQGRRDDMLVVDVLVDFDYDTVS